MLFTVFSPLTTAFKLCPDLMKHVSEGHGNSVKHALRVIAETTCRLTERVIGMGADGIFFATQLSSYSRAEEEFYREYGKPYDMEVLHASRGGAIRFMRTEKTSCFPC